MTKYLGYIVLDKPFVVVYAHPETLIKKRHVHGFLLTSDKENQYSFLPVVYDDELHRLYTEKGESDYYLGLFPQGMLDDKLENELKEMAKRIVPTAQTSSSYRRGMIMKILNEMEAQYPNGEVPRADLVARCAKEFNMKEDILENDIRMLYESGRIYIPRPGYVKIVPRRD
jgi:hypothetical protein